LELTPDLPDNPKELARWEGEPVQALIFPTDIFLTNKKGFPCLSKAHQDFALSMYRVRDCRGVATTRCGCFAHQVPTASLACGSSIPES
jgi:hypothetical protein